MKGKVSIGTGIKLMFGVSVILMVLIAVIGYEISSNADATGNKLYEAYGKSQGDVGMGFVSLESIKCSLRNALYLYTGDQDKQAAAIETVQEASDSMYYYLDMSEKEIEDSECLELLEDARTDIDAYMADVETCLNLLNENKLEEARKHLLNYGVESANAAEGTLTNMVTKLDQKAAKEKESFTKTEERGRILIFLFLLFSIVNCIFAIRYLLKHIKNPVVKLSKAADRVAKGEVLVDIPEEASVREIANLADSFREMVANLQLQANVVHQIAEGDLRVEIQAHSEDDAVGNALVKLIHDDNNTFNTIRNATNQISLGTSQIAAASQTLAQGSTQQASAIEQIAASISDIAGKTKENATQADEVNRIVLEAKDNVVAGNASMEEMVAAMEEITEASENIQKIIKVIDDIAFNTNILALNATVEAARAGEQGKGFAVVAEEVRNLAGRSAEASNQTEELIEDSISKVKRGGELAQQTAEALKVVSNIIEEITELSEDIAKASNDQATATSQIDQALMQVSQVVQTNSATSQQCASASEELSGQARGLNQELSRFQLKDVIGRMPSQTLEYTEPNMLDGNMKY